MIKLIALLVAAVALCVVFDLPILIVLISMAVVVALHVSFMAAITLTFAAVSISIFGFMCLPIIIPLSVVGFVMAMLIN